MDSEFLKNQDKIRIKSGENLDKTRIKSGKNQEKITIKSGQNLDKRTWTSLLCDTQLITLASDIFDRGWDENKNPIPVSIQGRRNIGFH